MIPHENETFASRNRIFIPRVLPNQRQRFETEEFFRKSAQTCEVNISSQQLWEILIFASFDKWFAQVYNNFLVDDAYKNAQILDNFLHLGLD